MTIESICSATNYPSELTLVQIDDPRQFLLDKYLELLKERIIVDASGKEINSRLTDLIVRAQADAHANPCPGEPFNKATIRFALSRLNYLFRTSTLANLPIGPAYERPMPDAVSPRDFGHEKVSEPMADYPGLSFLPVGGLGAPLCEIDYTTCYIREGFMVQDKAFRNLSVSLDLSGQKKQFPLAKTPGTYYALYPFSERSFELPIPFSLLQYSPVIPGDYQSSSLPVEIMEVVAENSTNKPLTLTFTINQENILGWYPKEGKDDPKNPHGPLVWKRQSKGNFTETFNYNNIAGLLYRHEGNHLEEIRTGVGLTGQIAIASLSNEKVKVTASPKTNSLTLKITLQPGEKISHPITVAYDNPFYHFQYQVTKPESPGVRFPKEYTRYYDTSGENAARMAADALTLCSEWKSRIISFQNTITNDSELPVFFQQALLNELYVLTETGIWEASKDRFAFLEGIDYKMYNTSDVNSYNWATLILFPELEKRDLLELASLVPLSDPTHRWWGTDRRAHIPPTEWKHLYWAPIKDSGAVCHDLGGLLGEGVFPFTNRCNEFNWSNANMWIDLAPKFALRSWRYFSYIEQQQYFQDERFINDIYPAVKNALDTLEKRWGDASTHVPISKGIPDWTYDTISGHGFTPNVVTQWLGALQVAENMARLVGDLSSADKYQQWFTAGQPVLAQLWNERGYFNAFVSPDGSKVNKNIHADMLFGDFYTRMIGLPKVVPDDLAAISLNTIYRNNGLSWSKVGQHGPMGLVNLRGPEGEQSKTEQGDEGWTGTMLLNAAYQIKLGKETNNQQLIDNGWNIVQGFYNVVYSASPDSQYWFGRTPEGYVNPHDLRFNNQKVIYGNETGRATKYMRALGIWAVYAALKSNSPPATFSFESLPSSPDTFNLPFGRSELACY